MNPTQARSTRQDGPQSVSSGTGWRPRVTVWVIVAAAVLLRLAFNNGVRSPDAAEYAAQARQLSIGTFVLPEWAYTVRYGLTGPIAISMRLFGVSELSTILFPLLCSVATVLIGYRIAVIVCGPRAGLFAAALLATLPLDVVEATDLHADVPMSMWLALTVMCMLRGAGATGRHRALWYASAGLAFSLAYLTKLTALSFFPGLVALSWLFRAHRQAWLAVIIFLVAVSVETACYGALTGRLGHRLSAEMGGGNHAGQIRRLYPDPVRNIWLAFTEVPDTLLRPWPLTPTPYFGVHFLLVPFAINATLRARDPRSRALLVWMTALYLPLSFGVIDYRTFAPVQIRAARVLEPLCVPGMVLLGCWLASLRRRTVAVLALVIVAPAAILSASILSFEDKQEFEPVRRIYLATLEHRGDETPVYCDPWLVSYLQYLDRYKTPSRFRPYPPDRSPGYLIVNQRTIDGMLRWDGVKLPEWVLTSAGREEIAIAHRKEQVRGGYRKRLKEGLSLFDVLWTVQESEGEGTVLYHVPSP